MSPKLWTIMSFSGNTVHNLKQTRIRCRMQGFKLVIHHQSLCPFADKRSSVVKVKRRQATSPLKSICHRKLDCIIVTLVRNSQHKASQGNTWSRIRAIQLILQRNLAHWSFNNQTATFTDRSKSSQGT